MNAVGIDVSKGKSTVAILRPMGELALPPREFPHTAVGLEHLTDAILDADQPCGETRVLMEAPGRYHEPVAAALHEAGFFVSVLNPILIHQSGGGSVRKVKNDRKDAVKIAKYGLDNGVKWSAMMGQDLGTGLPQSVRIQARNDGGLASGRLALSCCHWPYNKWKLQKIKNILP